MFLTSLVQIERRTENFCECVVEKAMSITNSIHGMMVQIKIELVACMGYSWEYQVCNWTDTVTIQIVVLSIPFSSVSIVYPTIFLQITVLWGLDAMLGDL